MAAARTTLLLVIPGRSTLRLELPAHWLHALITLLAFPLLVGFSAQRYLEHGAPGPARAGSPSRVPSRAAQAAAATPIVSALQLAAASERRLEHAFVSVARADTLAASARASLSGAAAMARPAEPLRAAPRPQPTAAETLDPIGAQWLHVQALHLGEALRVRPFDAGGAPDPEAFDALRHLMRCRVTGHEIEVDPRLIRILVQLESSFHREIQLVSGHRTPSTIGTHSTSQHTLGKAADIRLAGVSIEALRARALQLGARGVGLYPEKGFVHVDVRDKPKYYWTYTEAGGEAADMR